MAVTPEPIIAPVKEDSEIYFGNSKTLRTSSHRKMVLKFVRDQYPKARLERIYDASTDGWEFKDFDKCCHRKGWNLTIVMTTADFIFGAFTTVEWLNPSKLIHKHDPHSFLFSVDEGRKYPITGAERSAITFGTSECLVFGTTDHHDLVIDSCSNKSDGSWCDQKGLVTNCLELKGRDVMSFLLQILEERNPSNLKN